jgi:hypothetical protein
LVIDTHEEHFLGVKREELASSLWGALLLRINVNVSKIAVWGGDLGFQEEMNP